MASVDYISAVLPDPKLPPLFEDGFLIDLLADLTQQDRSRARHRLEQEQRDLGGNVRQAFNEWGLQPYVWHARLAEFYTQTDAFLFETLVWNRHPVKNQMRQWIGEFLQQDFSRPAKILTFGDGLGIDSLYLAQAGHSVDYFEVSPQCAQFARALGERMQTVVHVLDSKEQIARQSYDAIVCLDVLEHVPDPPALVAEFASYLKPGGRLIVHAPFWYIHPAVVTHLKANRKFSGDLAKLYRPCGFRLIAGQFFWSPIVLELTTAAPRLTKVPLTTRLSLVSGGLLLAVGRYWCWPHIFVSKQLLNRSKDLAAKSADII